MMVFSKGRYEVHVSLGRADLEPVLDLRQACFPHDARSGDSFDELNSHVCVVDRHSGDRVAGFRMLDLASGPDIQASYSAQFYDLDVLQTYSGPLLEIGRFCVRPDCSDPDVLRLLWAALANHVDARGIRLLFGCSSFAGRDPLPYAQAFALLSDRYLAPPAVSPKVKSGEVIALGGGVVRAKSVLQARAQLPPLLRLYLSMGGWVSDHAVVDRDMNTLHVFTGLEVSAIPEGRKRVLRSVLGAV